MQLGSLAKHDPDKEMLAQFKDFIAGCAQFTHTTSTVSVAEEQSLTQSTIKDY